MQFQMAHFMETKAQVTDLIQIKELYSVNLVTFLNQK